MEGSLTLKEELNELDDEQPFLIFMQLYQKFIPLLNSHPAAYATASIILHLQYEELNSPRNDNPFMGLDELRGGMMSEFKQRWASLIKSDKSGRERKQIIHDIIKDNCDFDIVHQIESSNGNSFTLTSVTQKAHFKDSKISKLAEKFDLLLCSIPGK